MKMHSLKKRIQITLRGYRIMEKYCPGVCGLHALSSLIAALLPFMTIWFSAQIVDELVGLCRLRRLLILVVSVLLINFVASLIQNTIKKLSDQRETQMWGLIRKLFTDRRLSLDFEDLESSSIREQGKRAEENLFMFGNGLAQLVWGINVLITAVTDITVSISMTITLFTAHSGNTLIDSPIWVAVIAVFVAFGGLVNQHTTLRENILFEEYCHKTIWFHRSQDFFAHELYAQLERAKDVHIYRQHVAADQEIHKMECFDNEQTPYYRKMSALQMLSVLSTGIGNAVCYLYVVLKAYFGAFGVGSILQYAGVLLRLSEGIQYLMFAYGDNNAYCTHLDSLYAYLDIPSGTAAGTRQPTSAFHTIEFCDVSFCYPESERLALSHVSLTLEAGKKLALVGLNGSGKTTFIKLLCRLYRPSAGKILLDGVDIWEYDNEAYKALLSVVFQDFRLFAFTLAQNVAADSEYDSSQIIDALNRVGFAERLTALPNGIDTLLYHDLNENGVGISGGEEQKIALARALYRNTPIIILDEPTAALDPIAEAEIYESFSKIVEGKTVLFISHRLSSCRSCDKIAVFDAGRLVGQGTHEELLTNADSPYAAMWRVQAQYYQNPD